MSNLVFIENNRVVTDSLMVAEVFGKEHKNVLKDIRELGCSGDFGRLNFEQSSYVNKQNKTMPKVLITQDGFTLLAMGYTGQQAMEFKEKYIAEFNRMKDTLNGSQTLRLPQSFSEALRLAADLQDQIEHQKPLVSFAETCMRSKDSILVRQVAKLACDEGVRIGEKRLYVKLREWGLVLQTKTEPTQKAMDAGYFEVSQGVKETVYGAKTWRTTLVTPKGQVYIIERLKKEC